MKPSKLLARLSAGQTKNVRSHDALRLAEALGFELDRTSGSHHILVHPKHPDQLNLQSVRGQAKPYQLKQLLQLVEVHKLSLDEDA